MTLAEALEVKPRFADPRAIEAKRMLEASAELRELRIALRRKEQATETDATLDAGRTLTQLREAISAERAAQDPFIHA